MQSERDPNTEYVELREQLRIESPELYNSLMRSWNIANEEWLPAISGNKGCFNAYPHIRNHERYANNILKQVHQEGLAAGILQMSPVEKYLLLAAMLMHDVGRTQVGKGHAVRSRQIIRSNYSELGIENRSLARLLADICCYHDCTQLTADALDLREHGITPYGVIHAKRIAVFLKFIDNLDGAYTRVLPHYLKGDPKDMIEGFRRSTAGIRVDLQNHMVVTTTQLPLKEIGELSSSCVYRKKGTNGEVNWPKNITSNDDNYPSVFVNPEFSLTQCARESIIDMERLCRQGNVTGMRSVLSRMRESMSDDEPDEKLWKRIEEALSQSIENPIVRGQMLADLSERMAKQYLTSQKDDIRSWFGLDGESLVKAWESNAAFSVAEREEPYISLPNIDSEHISIEHLLPYLVLRKNLFVSPARNDHVENVSKLLFLSIVGNIRSSAVLLEDIRDHLGLFGVPLDAWLFELDEHLFTCGGRETYEPSLSKDFLCKVVNAMYHLSANVFGRETFDYSILSAKLRKSDIALVRTAVRRIGIVTRHKKGQSKNSCYVVHFTENEWRWNPRGEEETEHGDIGCHCQLWVKNKIKQLAEPWDDIGTLELGW